MLDTNVVLDFILKRKDFFNDAEQIFKHLDENLIEVFVATITPINVFYTTRKERNKASAFEAVKFLVDAVQFSVDDISVFKQALDLDFSDYEDAVQCASAIAADLDAIVTRNTKDYKKSPIPVYSPAAFLAHLQGESAG